VLWQTGSTDCTGLDIITRPQVPSSELQDAMRDADVVVAHAGTGVALAALEAGKWPVLVPRRAAFGEHVDDHQTGIARELGGRGLAVVREADQIVLDDLVAATAKRVTRVVDVPKLQI
jgi:UDP-N-acetylglucosamine transferase subunit ALG13